MAVAIGLQRYFVGRQRNQTVDWADFLTSHASFWLAWVIVGRVTVPVVLRIIGGSMRRTTKAAALVALCIVVVTLQPALDILQRATVLAPRIDVPTLDTFIFFLFAPLPHNVLVFAAVVGLTYAMWYYEHFRDRELAAAQLGAQLTQARLDALRAQLNPHFLFNAMNSIAMLVRGNSNAQAVRMLAGLSDLLRWALDDGLPPRIPLSQELQFIERYLSIEQVRFQNRLRVEMAIDDRTLPMLVPTLLLQPLVENAVRHGIGQRRSAGALRIASTVRGDQLELEVRDDGPGLPAGFRIGMNGGVGLRNTEARLAAAYGSAWSFDLDTLADGGTVANVRIPAST
jgi:two-component system LytT family sensor kinase